MPVENLPQLSLGSAALIIFLICAGFIFVRGVTRMIFGALVLCGSAWVGFQVWQKAPTWAIDWTGKPVAWISTGLPVLAFLGTFIFAKIIIGFFLKPFKRSGDGGPKTMSGIFVRLAMAVIPTGLVWLTGATLVHHFGSIAEIRQSTAQAGKGKEMDFLTQARELKEAIAAVVPADWLAKLDPLADKNHLSLAKLIASQPKPDRKPVIDPQTGKPYPRAIIVDEPALQDLASDGQFSTLLRHPLFQKALNDPKVQQALKDRASKL